MKKPDKSHKFLSYVIRKSNRFAKRRRVIKLKKKKEKARIIGKSYFQQRELNKFKYYDTVVAPKNFSFIDNIGKTVNFIEQLYSRFNKGKSVFVDLHKVEFLDYGAITVLLSVMNKFKVSNVNFNGNFPLNPEVKHKLIDSQFFSRLEKHIGYDHEYLIKKKNQIFTHATKLVRAELGLQIMEEATETIWGEKRACRGLQRVLIEIMQNTHDHAVLNKEGVELWWLSVNHDSENKKVSFVFVDYGQGIFESLNSKSVESKWFGWLPKMKYKLTRGDNPEILQKLLDGELHMTVTGKHFRGKGLPGIKEVFNKKQISSLYVISNNVYADVKNNRYVTINKEFRGTFLYWELCLENENTTWNI